MRISSSEVVKRRRLTGFCGESLVFQPIVLSIYERFYLPLSESLRPATKAFILALLPGLEEETGEWFEKVRPSWTDWRSA